MPAVLINHRVADFAKWVKVYEEHGAEREHGATDYDRLAGGDDPSNVFILIKGVDAAKAQAFYRAERGAEGDDAARRGDQPAGVHAARRWAEVPELAAQLLISQPQRFSPARMGLGTSLPASGASGAH